MAYLVRWLFAVILAASLALVALGVSFVASYLVIDFFYGEPIPNLTYRRTDAIAVAPHEWAQY